MKVFDITEAPSVADQYKQATPKPRFSQMAQQARSDNKQKRDDALKAKQSSTNREKSKKRGIIGQFAQEKGMKNKIVADERGLFYQMQPQDELGKDWRWQEINITGGRKPDAGQSIPSSAVDPKNIKNAPTKALAPKDGLSMELSNIAKGVEKPDSAVDKMKDKVTKAIGGPLASKTMSDPDATTGQKIGAVAGAGLGRLAGKALGALKPQAQAEPETKALSSQSHRQLGALQQKVMSTGDVEAAKALVDMLSAKSKEGADPAEISNYANTVAPILKRNKEFQKNNPQVYANLVTLARQMRKEAYEHLCRVLEHANLTWEDLGYRVSLTESNVILFPHEELTQIEESIALEELKVLSGV